MLVSDDVFATLTENLVYLRSNGSKTFKNRAYLRDFWVNRGIESVFDKMLQATVFLPQTTSISVRYYFIEHGLTSIPLCKHCQQPIKLPNAYGACVQGLPVVHNKCLAAYTKDARTQTCIERYGGNPMKNEAVKAKNVSARRPGMLAAAEKGLVTRKLQDPTYGALADERRERSKRAMLERERGITPHQRHISETVLARIDDQSWLRAEYETKSAKQIAIEQGVNKTIIQNRIHKFAIPVIKRYSSIAETELANYIESLDVGKVLRNVKINGFELDVFVPSRGVAVEYHGLYWHVEGNQPRKNIHLLKYKTCRDAGITLIQVWSNEWEQRKQLVLSKIDHLFGKTCSRVHGRRCEVREVSTKTTAKFCETYHIQGNAPASVRLGLYHNEMLVAVMTFGASRYDKTKQWEMIRYCTSTSVVGGASKLFSAFVRLHAPTSIVSYSNNRFGSGKMYQTLGFKFVHETPSNYYYVNLRDTSRTYHRTAFQKHMLSTKLSSYDSNKTEYENMVANGYDRIWDAGNKLYLWESPTTISNCIAEDT